MFVPKTEDGEEILFGRPPQDRGLTWPRTLKMERRRDRPTDISQKGNL